MKISVMPNWKYIQQNKMISQDAKKYFNEFLDISRINIDDINNIKEDILYILSDYSGLKNKNRFSVFSFLVFFPHHSGCFFINQEAVRRDLLPNARRISYKSLRDKKKMEAMIPFLATVDKINGVLFTIAIQNNCTFLDSTENDFRLNSWKEKIRSKVGKIVELAGLIAGQFVRENQKIIWITDQDEIVANDKLLSELEALFSQSVNRHSEHKIESCEIATSASDEDNRRLEDVLSVCDLSAGAVSEIINKERKLYEDVLLPSNYFNPSRKAVFILSWLSAKSELMKLAPLIYRERQGKLDFLCYVQGGQNLYEAAVESYFDNRETIRSDFLII